jgi:hypothetical protein
VTLLGLRPDGHLWQTRYEGEAADEEAARIWQDISDHIVLWARWANEPGTTPFAVTSGERRPQRTPPFVAVPLPVPLDKAKLQATELIDELRQRAYWLDGRQWDIPDILLADEGEIDFRSACVPVPAASDGRAELDELCRLLA